MLERAALYRLPKLAQERIRVVVATKNSAKWFGTLIDAYRRIGIEPLVLLDGFSEDGTEDLLNRKGIEYAKVFPEFPRVEAIISLIPAHSESEWVFRLDDDEFPSRALVSWIHDHLAGMETKVIGVPRRWVRLGNNGRCDYSNHRLLRWHQDRMDIQWRLFKPRAVEYIADIHSPGFRVPPDCPVAPDLAYIVHFDWVIRSWDARAKKLEHYDEQRSGAGSSFRELYLWESSDIASHGFERMGTSEFDGLAKTLSLCSGTGER
jgi:hypothetical protein